MKRFLPSFLRLAPRSSLFVLLTLFPLLLVSPSAIHAQWGPVIRITFNDSTSITSPNNAWCVAGGFDGNVHVTWTDYRQGYFNPQIYYKRSTDSGLTWSSDTCFSTLSSSNPSIAATGSDVHIVWGGVYYKRSTDSGITWSSNITLASGSSPCIVATGSNVFAVFNRGKAVYLKRSTDSGLTWDPDVRLNRIDSSYSPSVSITGYYVHVVWMDTRTGRWNPNVFYARSSDRGQTWLPDTQITTSGYGYSPCVGSSGPLVHVVWHDGAEIFYKRSTNFGESWLPDTQLTNAANESQYPSISASGPNVHVVWQDYRDWNWEVYYKQSTDSGSTWLTDFRISNAPDGSRNPSVTVCEEKIYVVWRDNGDGNDEIFFRRNLRGNMGIGGREGLTQTKTFSPLRIVPSPFSSFAKIPGFERKHSDWPPLNWTKKGLWELRIRS